VADTLLSPISIAWISEVSLKTVSVTDGSGKRTVELSMIKFTLMTIPGHEAGAQRRLLLYLQTPR